MPTLPIYDKRMLELIDILKQRGNIRFTADFCRAIDIERQSITNIRNGKQSFQTHHILKAVQVYGISADWIYGISNKVFIKKHAASARKDDLLLF